MDIDVDGKVLLEFDAPVVPGKRPKVDAAPVEDI